MAEKKITILQKNELGQLDTYYPKTIADQVVESEEKKFLSAAKEAQYDANTLYNNETPIVTAIGSIEAGDTFENVPVSEMLTKILYPYVKPTISGSASVGTRTVEKGVTTNVTWVKAVVGKKSEAITSVTLYNGSTLVEEKTDGVANGGTIQFDQAIAITDTATLKVKATDAKPTTVEATAATYTYVYPYYYGVVAAGTAMTSDVVVGLTKDVTTKGSKTYTYNLENNCAVIAYPKSYGQIKKVLDPNGFDNIASYTKSEVSVTGTDGSAQAYYVYVKAAGTASGFKLAYSY